MQISLLIWVSYLLHSLSLTISLSNYRYIGCMLLYLSVYLSIYITWEYYSEFNFDLCFPPNLYKIQYCAWLKSLYWPNSHCCYKKGYKIFKFTKLFFPLYELVNCEIFWHTVIIKTVSRTEITWFIHHRKIIIEVRRIRSRCYRN